MRQADGKIAWVRIEESTRETSRARASRAAQDISDHYRDQAYRPQTKANPSFEEAALTYVKTKGSSKRDRDFIARLVEVFGETSIAEIDQALVADAAHTLYPDAKASTHMRAVYAPTISILRLSGLSPDLARPKIERKPPKVPPEEWYEKIVPKCPPRLAALILFCTLTGRRITEALTAELNPDGKSVTIPKTKTGKPAVVELPDPVLAWLAAATAKERKPRSKRLFGYENRGNVYRALRPICKRLGVKWYGTHAFGRHAFATRLLREGWSVKHVAAGGGWESPKMVLETYGHIEHSEVGSNVKERGDKWGKDRKILPKSPENR